MDGNLFIAVVFALITLGSKKLGILPSLNNVKRKTHGSYIYPMSIFLMYLVSITLNSPLLFYLPISIMVVSDPLASITGKNWQYIFAGKGVFMVNQQVKTFAGSTIFFLSAFIISILFLSFHENLSLGYIYLLSFTIAIFSSIIEAISIDGWDNVTVPLSILIILIIV